MQQLPTEGEQEWGEKWAVRCSCAAAPKGPVSSAPSSASRPHSQTTDHVSQSGSLAAHRPQRQPPPPTEIGPPPLPSAAAHSPWLTGSCARRSIVSPRWLLAPESPLFRTRDFRGATRGADDWGGWSGHVYGKSTRKEYCYDNLHISKNAWDTNLVKVAPPAPRHEPTATATIRTLPSVSGYPPLSAQQP